jgi:type II secretory ATPase GspE/PulE/Tfp pilus assembly ATPase PilB-like protein
MNATGYQGRFGVFELLVVTDRIQSLITDRATAAEIRSVAITEGMPVMRHDGIQKVIAGDTTIDEIVRVTVDASPSP